MNSAYEMYHEWKTKIFEPYKQTQNETQYSDIFCLGVTSDYDERKNTIMIIGQEPNNYGYYDDGSTLESLIEWPQKYMDRQLLGEENGKKNNSSPFWKLFREYYKQGFNVVWNNLDKVHKYVNEKTTALSEEEEISFNAGFGQGNKSLLLQEIELIRPDVIVFITGPNYNVSMASSLGIDRDILVRNYAPSSDRFITNISDIVQLGVPTYWTYHPKYLNMKHSIREVVETSLSTLRRVNFNVEGE